MTTHVSNYAVAVIYKHETIVIYILLRSYPKVLNCLNTLVYS